MQSAQVRRCLGSASEARRVRRRRERKDGGVLLGEAGVLGVVLDGPSRGMMVLLVLQVHLQKDVGAEVSMVVSKYALVETGWGAWTRTGC